MRKLFIILTLLSLAFSGVASAVEYVVVNGNNKSVKLDPTDIVQVVGHSASNRGEEMKIDFPGWGYLTLRSIVNTTNGYKTTSSKIGMIITGATEAKIEAADLAVTLKITKASEINKVGPTSVLVLPENARGNYDLIVESSSDSVTWTPFHSQAVQSDTVKRLFRVRIVHKGQEEAKAKAEEK